MTESVPGLTAAKSRRDRLKGAVDDLDRRIAELERRQSRAGPADRAILARDIRALGEQRLTAVELLSDAETQHLAKRGEHDQAMDAVAKGLPKIAQACTDAARRFDRALSVAVAAFDEIEREAAPLENTLIPNGIRPRYTHARCINAALTKAFGARLGRAVEFAEKQALSDRIGMMISDARQNAAQLRKKEAA